MLMEYLVLRDAQLTVMVREARILAELKVWELQEVAALVRLQAMLIEVVQQVLLVSEVVAVAMVEEGWEE